MSKPKYYGKYRAKVVDVQDPEHRGRIRVQCPKVLLSAKSAWCEPCVPVAYDNGGDFCLPKVGETVWVEFEGGDPNHPIHSGNWWSKDKSPITSYEDLSKRIRTIEFDGAKIEFISGEHLKISMGENSITLFEETISIESPKNIRLSVKNSYLNVSESGVVYTPPS